MDRSEDEIYAELNNILEFLCAELEKDAEFPPPVPFADENIVWRLEPDKEDGHWTAVPVGKKRKRGQ